MNALVKCKDCRFWIPGKEKSGWCHRHAPIPYINRRADSAAKELRWPPTHAENRCGEGEPRE